jgi:hypothetical protein
MYGARTWVTTTPRHIRFVIAATHPGANVTATCRAFGISRKTGYKWLRRNDAEVSVAALADRSRRPHDSPARTTDHATARVVALRGIYGWGGDNPCRAPCGRIVPRVGPRKHVPIHGHQPDEVRLVGQLNAPVRPQERTRTQRWRAIGIAPYRASASVSPQPFWP